MGADCSKQGDVEKVVDRELNEEDIGTVDVGILAAKNPGVHSLKRTGDKDGELSDPKVQTVEVTYYYGAHSSASNLYVLRIYHQHLDMIHSTRIMHGDA